MADEIQVTRTPRTSPAAAAPPLARRTTPDDPEAARAEIEATRARMSGTIDEIEDALLRRKEDIREKLDVLAPVREQPLKTLGMIFGATLVLGLLTGGGRSKHRDDPADDDGTSRTARRARISVEEDEDEDDGEEEATLAWQRAEEWEDRAHRLLRIARVQETELDIHREREGKMRRQLRAQARYAEDEDEEEDYDDAEPNFFQRMRDSAADRLAVLAGEVSHRMMRGG